MVDQTQELLQVIEDQQALIAELLKLLPLTGTSQEVAREMQASVERTAASIQRIKANFANQAVIEAWGKDRKRVRGRKVV